MDRAIKPAERLSGEIKLPGDKSISHRVILIGGIAQGKTRGKNFLNADDCLRTVSAFLDMGIEIEEKGGCVTVFGKGLKGLKSPARELYLGNSGTTMRVLPGILAGQPFESTITGDESLSKRPMERIIEPLKGMGVDIRSKGAGGFPPLVVKGGRVKPVKYKTKVASAQVKSCILLAGLYAEGVTSVTEPFISRDHTERMLKICGAKISKSGLTVSVEGPAKISGKEFFIPGDISSAAFFIAATCLLEGSSITIREVGLNPTRMGFINALAKMGADITAREKKGATLPYGDVRVRYAKLKPAFVKRNEIPLLIDEVPVLALICASVEGRSVLEGVSELRVKETDRIFSLTENLRRMGVDIKAENDTLIINGKKERFKKAGLESFKDHRTAMSMSIAALAADGECTVKDTSCVNTSFPEFFEILESLKK